MTDLVDVDGWFVVAVPDHNSFERNQPGVSPFARNDVLDPGNTDHDVGRGAPLAHRSTVSLGVPTFEETGSCVWWAALGVTGAEFCSC